MVGDPVIGSAEWVSHYGSDRAKAEQAAYMRGYEAGLKVAQGLMQPPPAILLCAECPRKEAVLSEVHHQGKET